MAKEQVDQIGVLIVLVNYKRPIDTLECIKSLCSQDHAAWDCVICENGSEDGSFELLAKGIGELIETPEVNIAPFAVEADRIAFKIIRNGVINRVVVLKSAKNLGFAGGNNYAVATFENWQESTSKYYWFLNNDTVVAPNCLTELVTYMDSSAAVNVGICGATILQYGSNSVVQNYGGASYNRFIGQVTELGKGDLFDVRSTPSNIDTQLDYISGASMFVPRLFVEKAGAMSEEYFLYFEEMDWSVRGKKCGFRLGYAPQAIVWHKEGLVLGSGAVAKRSVLAEFYGLRSRLRFTFKFYPHLLPMVWIGGLTQVIKRALTGRHKNSQALLLALLFRDNP